MPSLKKRKNLDKDSNFFAYASTFKPPRVSFRNASPYLSLAVSGKYLARNFLLKFSHENSS
ncbi:hypothetical protein A2U01_0093027 [Trifolium medium]|uniref:Uncharacterized protein n=1 Tax=Trifolium medium TaxID=97028 RepID=A0A392UGE9_9FABA|nr:hypothetical protein [Trifolium medium]